MITIPIWAFILIILFSPFVLFILVYFIAGIIDLITASKVAKGKYDNCPYEIEVHDNAVDKIRQ